MRKIEILNITIHIMHSHSTYKKLLCLILSAMSLSSVATAQNMVSGRIVDKDGNPVAGAAVLVPENNLSGTVTDEEGNWTLDVKPGNTLQVSSLGFKSRDIKITSSSSWLDIVLEDDVNMLDDLVVIGYGSARKGDLTGSISSVKGNILVERSATQLSTALQGQIPGLQITRSSGDRSLSSTIRIHGITTISTNDPLVIIDGVPGTLDDVMAEDVLSLSVLKDAASASIYGSRAAAGVILVTTRRADNKGFSFDYDYKFQLNKAATRPELGNVVDYMEIANELKYNDGADQRYSVYSKETIDNWMANHAKDPIHYPDTDWPALLLNKSFASQQHNFSVSGGTDRLSSKFSMNYLTSDGYYKNKTYDRLSLRMNNDYKIAKWLKASLDAHFTETDSRTTSASRNAIYYAYLLAPYYTPYWADGSYADVKDGDNYLAALNEGGSTIGKNYKVGGKFQIDITPQIKGLTFTALVAPDLTLKYYKKFEKRVYVQREDGTKVISLESSDTNLSEERNTTKSFTVQAFVNYNLQHGNHDFKAMAGYEGFSHKWEDLAASRKYFTLTNFPYLDLGPEDYQYNSGTAGHNAYQSYFARGIYSYKNRYILQANIRADASSRFAKAHRWGVFPSVSAGWVISDEPWFNVRPISYLKLRASWGQLGNERIGSEFPYQASIDFGNSYMYDKSSGSVTAVQNAHQTTYAFEDITWETTTSKGLGLDATFLDGRLRFTGDVYHKTTTNMLLELAFPSYSGFSAPEQNAGDMYTKGYDLEIGWSDRIGDFSYGFSANLSDYRSKMGAMRGKSTISGNYITEEGSYYREWYMYQSDGLFLNDSELFDSEGKKVPVMTGNDKAGCIRYVNQDDNEVINADDKIRLGNSLPEYLFGGNIHMGYKSWDFSLSFQGVGHQNVLFNTEWIQPLRVQWGAVPALLLGNYWSSDKTDEQNSKAKYPYLTWNNTSSIYAGSDYWLFNGAYFRVKDITLAYTVPQHMLNRLFLKGLKVYANITDLPAISHYPKGWDPECTDYNTAFITTTFSLGVNVKF